uniref:Sushi domain-containing protein n=1 Tax=Anopheles dirus TaxID=7168 RepID=A0A182NIR7_9DIPT
MLPTVDGDDGMDGRSAPQRSGKKGRRRKGHKKHKKHKKIKLLPVTLVGVPVDENGRPDAGLIEGLTNGAAEGGPWSLESLTSAKANPSQPEEKPTDGRRSNKGSPAARVDAGVVEMVDVWKETTMPPSPASGSDRADRSPGGDFSPRRVASAVSGFPPPPVLVGDGHLVFGGVGSDRPDDHQQQRTDKWRKRDKQQQQRKQLEKAGEKPPPPPSGVTVASASTVTFPADDHKGTETVSVARVIISGDLSCMRDDFIPAPPIANGDIKYLRNDLYGLEHSYLEAEYHCRLGYRLRVKDAGQGRPLVTSTGAIANANLVCRRSRWIGKRPVCVRIKLQPAATVGWQRPEPVGPCGKDHRCPQACHRAVPDGAANGSLNRTATVCTCYKGFKMVNHRCV